MVDEVRTIIYFWWRKAEKNNLIIKFGDHTEPISEPNWYKNTEKYIQKTAAPRESKTFKDLIEYEILDITEYAKQVKRNRKYAKIDNYITRITDLEKYRIGQTDQFKLPKFTIDFDDFIDKIKDLVYDGKDRIYNLPLSMNFNYQDIENLKASKEAKFNFPISNKEYDVLSVALATGSESMLIVTESSLYEDIIRKHKEFRNYLIYHNNQFDARFWFTNKRIMISKNKENEDNYDIVIEDSIEQSFFLKKLNV